MLFLPPIALRLVRVKKQGKPASSCGAAFTLLEILSVLALISVLLALTPLGMDVLRGRNLSRATDALTLLFEGARQHALASGNPTAAVILTNIDPDGDGRAMTLMQYTRQGGWKQLSGWSFLPEGYCVEVGVNATENTFVSVSDPSQGLPQASQSPVTFRGQIVPSNGYAYRVFLPKGGVLDTTHNPIRLRVIEGEVKNGVSRARRDVAYTLSLISATGQTKVDQP